MATVVQLTQRGWLVVALLLGVTGCVSQPSDPFLPDAATGEPETVTVPNAQPEPKTREDVVRELRQEALAQQAGGEWANAAALLERALRIDSSSPELYLQIAEVRLGQSRFAEAEQVASKGLSLVGYDAGTEARLWQVTAQARSGQGDTAGAREAREQACSLGAC